MVQPDVGECAQQIDGRRCAGDGLRSRLASGVLLFALYRSLERTAQRGVGDRTEQISEQLQTDAPRELDRSMLVTDSQIGAVQIVDSTGVVLRPPTVPLRRRWRAWH